jgi:hypothetical protein
MNCEMRVGFFKKKGRVSKIRDRRNNIRYYKVALYITSYYIDTIRYNINCILYRRQQKPSPDREKVERPKYLFLISRSVLCEKQST